MTQSAKELNRVSGGQLIPLTRARPAELAQDAKDVVASPVVRALLECLGGGVMVLNGHRQVVAADLRNLLPEPEQALRKAIGLRPGEVLGCIRATERPEGCGASEACRTCGALQSILGCQATRAPVDGECAITGEGRRPFELRVRATPIEVEGRPFVVLAIRDASDEKRRQALEQVFFHDLLNSVTGVHGWSQLLLRVPADRVRTTAERLDGMVRRLEAEIRSQRAMLDAEEGRLELDVAPVGTAALLRQVAADFDGHPAARGRELELGELADVEVETDAALAARVLMNMVTNALEATPAGGEVRLSCRREPPGTEFACAYQVRNEAVIPPTIAARVFDRSFSTKARQGRGLGTYSMKLLGERYLGGEVSFVSEEGTGTVFTLRLPARVPQAGLREPLPLRRG